MADQQAAPVPAPANNLTATQTFYRILYNGNSTNWLYTKQVPVDFAHVQDIFECAITMAQENIELPIAAIKKVYEKKAYWDVQYIMAALAYCAKQKHVPELKELAYHTASDLLDNQKDFLMFVKFCRIISHLLNNLEDASTINNPNDNPQRHGGAGFGRGMRKMALRWYGKYNPEQLANMFGDHRSMCHLTHKRVIMKAHMRTDGDKPRFKKNRKRKHQNVGANASTSQSVPVPSTSSATVPEANVAGENAAVVQVAAEHETDRNHVFEFVMMTGTEYLKFLAGIPELGPGAKRMKLLQILKTNMNIDDAANSITENQFTLDQMPAHLLETASIWEKLLPDMTMKQCLDHFHTIRDFKFLNPDDQFADYFIQQLELKTDQLKTGDICPIELFILRKLYENNVRYLNKTKADWYQKKVDKKKLKVNSLIQSHLASYFDLALSAVQIKLSATYFFTIDLRTDNSKKYVTRNKYINCTEASILLAYSTYERAKDVSIYTFSGKVDGDLQEIHSLLKHDNFQHAKQICEQKSCKKTFQSLSKPIAEATKMKKVVDIFVVIVDSVARFCRQGQVPEREFAEYKAKFNAHAKFLVVNLARPTHDLKIPENENMTGFFEICGFTKSTPKIMNALATQSFR